MRHKINRITNRPIRYLELSKRNRSKNGWYTINKIKHDGQKWLSIIYEDARYYLRKIAIARGLRRGESYDGGVLLLDKSLDLISTLH